MWIGVWIGVWSGVWIGVWSGVWIKFCIGVLVGILVSPRSSLADIVWDVFLSVGSLFCCTAGLARLVRYILRIGIGTAGTKGVFGGSGTIGTAIGIVFGRGSPPNVFSLQLYSFVSFVLVVFARFA